MANSDIKLHISSSERIAWNKNIVDLTNHIGAGGVANHRLGNGSVPGFSTNDYTNAEKTKLAGIQDGALNNPHPATHPASMITGLASVATSGNYYDLLNRPTSMTANGGNSDTVGGIRITIGAAPSNPQNLKEIWFNSANWIVYTYYNNTWVPARAVFT